MKRIAMFGAAAVFAAAGVVHGEENDLADAVKASSFGWNPTNATKCLQAAFDSGAKKVLIDRQASEWLVTTVFPRSDQEVIVDDGVTVRALPGAFKSITDSLFNYRWVTNVVLRAKGSGRLMMNRKDYWNTDEYAWSEWRHGINMMGVVNAVIRDITLEESGGDGIYVNGVDNGLIENVKSLRHHRQGISIIGCRGLTVRDCLFAETKGTLPECGFDMEPSGGGFIIEDVAFENCRFLDNNCHGIAINIGHFKDRQKNLNVRFTNCVSKRNKYRGIWLVMTSGINGKILFDNCEVADNGSGPLSVEELPGNSIKVGFRNCLFDASTVTGPAINLHNGSMPDDLDNLVFQGCRVKVGTGEVAAFSGMTGVGIRRVLGTLDVTDAAGKCSKFDLSEFAKRFVPHPELRQFAVTPVELGKLRPLKPEAFVAKQRPCNFRGGVQFLQYVTKPGEYPIRLDIHPLGRWNKINAKIDVYDAAGTTHDSVKITEKDYTYVLKAKYANAIYRLAIDVGAAYVHVVSPYPGQGFLADRITSWMGAGNDDFYFEAKKGTEEVKIKFAPQPGEHITAELYDAQGTLVDRFEHRGATSFLMAKRPKNAPSEIWRVRCVKFVEDCGVRLGKGLTAVYAMDPDLVLVEK